MFIPENVLDEYTQDMYIHVGMPVIAKKTKHGSDELLFPCEYRDFYARSYGDMDAEYVRCQYV
jgi:hypothetical protein